MGGVFKSGLLLAFVSSPCIRCNISGLQREKITHLCATLRLDEVPETWEGQAI